MFFNPFFVQPQQFDPFKSWGDMHARVATLAAEGAKVESKARAHTLQMVEEWAKLAKASVDYSTELTAEMRKLTLDAMKPQTTTGN
jgi:hypothetical protein